MKTIHTYHLYNDYSGSPKILMQLIKYWSSKNYKVSCTTSLYNAGFLSNLPKVTYNNNSYKLGKNKWGKLFYLLYSQLLVMLTQWKKINKNDLVYINTMLPFGAAILGKLRGAKVVYHIHETSIKPAFFKFFLRLIINKTAHKAIFVSKHLAKQEKLKIPTVILHNAIENDFYNIAKQKVRFKKKIKNVLMLCSLKKYKGVDQFIALAKNNSNLNFRLVLNANNIDIQHYFKGINLSNNIQILPTQTNVHPHYQWADMLLNLSLPDLWVETFGLTVIEAMCYALPTIVPNIGGICELVEHKKNGYTVNTYNIKAIENILQELHNNSETYLSLSSKAFLKVKNFKEDIFFNKHIQILKSL